MPMPALFRDTLSIPVIGAPMFLVSFPPLVTALCKAGVVGTFPHVNARPAAQLDEWLTAIERDLAAHRAAEPGAGAAGRETLGSRFRWLTAPRSTVIQPGPVHTGLTEDPDAEADRLLRLLVLPVTP